MRVYSVASGETIHDLSGHRDTVTSIVIHPENQFQALSCGTDKCIVRWDYTDGILLQVMWKLAHPVAFATIQVSLMVIGNMSNEIN